MKRVILLFLVLLTIIIANKNLISQNSVPNNVKHDLFIGTGLTVPFNLYGATNLIGFKIASSSRLFKSNIYFVSSFNYDLYGYEYYSGNYTMLITQVGIKYSKYSGKYFWGFQILGGSNINFIPSEYYSDGYYEEWLEYDPGIGFVLSSGIFSGYYFNEKHTLAFKLETNFGYSSIINEYTNTWTYADDDYYYYYTDQEKNKFYFLNTKCGLVISFNDK